MTGCHGIPGSVPTSRRSLSCSRAPWPVRRQEARFAPRRASAEFFVSMHFDDGTSTMPCELHGTDHRWPVETQDPLGAAAHRTTALLGAAPRLSPGQRPHPVEGAEGTGRLRTDPASGTLHHPAQDRLQPDGQGAHAPPDLGGDGRMGGSHPGRRIVTAHRRNMVRHTLEPCQTTLPHSGHEFSWSTSWMALRHAHERIT